VFEFLQFAQLEERVFGVYLAALQDQHFNAMIVAAEAQILDGVETQIDYACIFEVRDGSRVSNLVVRQVENLDVRE